MRDQFITSLTSQLEDSTCFLLTGDLGFGIFDNIANLFPHQFINTGVAEQNLSSIAAGLALDGNRVFTYSIGNFNTLRCYEQIRNDIIYHDCNIAIVTSGAGFSYGQLGMSHFAIEDVGVFRLLPNIRILTPSSDTEMSLCMNFLLNNPGPAYLRIDKSSLSTDALYLDSLLQPNCHMSGSDILFLSYGGIAQECLDAALMLSKNSLSCSVYTLPLIKPLPVDCLQPLLISHRYVVCVEEHMITGGLCSAIAELKSHRNIHTPQLSLAIPSCYPSIVGDQTFLRRHFNLDSLSIYQQTLEFTERV